MTTFHGLPASCLAAMVDFCDFSTMPYDPIGGWWYYGGATHAEVDAAIRTGKPDYELLETVDNSRLLLAKDATDRALAILDTRVFLSAQYQWLIARLGQRPTESVLYIIEVKFSYSLVN